MSDFEMNELAMLQAHFWNVFYEVHGFRPRHLSIDSWSIEQIRSELDKLVPLRLSRHRGPDLQKSV